MWKLLWVVLTCVSVSGCWWNIKGDASYEAGQQKADSQGEFGEKVPELGLENEGA